MQNVEEKIKLLNPFYSLISLFNGYNNEIKVKCNNCNEIIYYKKASNIIYKKVKCPECERRLKEKEFISHLKKYRPEIEVLGKYINTKTKIKVKCNNCGNIYDAYPNNLRIIPKGNRHGCSNCLHIKGKTNEEF